MESFSVVLRLTSHVSRLTTYPGSFALVEDVASRRSYWDR